MFGKIFEKVIYTRLHDFITKNRIISEFQFGFQKFHSTTHATYDSIDFIKQSHSRSRHVLALFIDLSKAFDTIDHKILMHKLYNHGIRGLPYELILSYLSNRFRCTEFNGHTSDKEKVVYGIPQGSVLGPLLFLLYINDMQNCNKDANIKFVLYADDTDVFIASDTIEKCIEEANYILASIEKYISSNLLHINLDKSCYMWFKYKNIKSCLCTTNKCPLDNSKNKSSPKNYKQYCNNEPSSIYIGSTKITFETEVRYLEVILDSKLLLNAHTKFLVKKLKTKVATIKRISANIPKGCLKSVCHTLFESHLILYGISVWGNTSQANIDKLFHLQKRCIRIILGDREKF